LFDLWFAWSQSQAGVTPYTVDGKRAMEAFEWYLANEGTAMGIEEAGQLLDQRLRNPAFRQDMDTLELRKWVHGGGRVLPGLVARRQAEIALIGQ
jgi:hypothetical protein